MDGVGSFRKYGTMQNQKWAHFFSRHEHPYAISLSGNMNSNIEEKTVYWVVLLYIAFILLEWTTSLDSSSGSLICDSLTHLLTVSTSRRT